MRGLVLFPEGFVSTLLEILGCAVERHLARRSFKRVSTLLEILDIVSVCVAT